jgi:hypothetical protein
MWGNWAGGGEVDRFLGLPGTLAQAGQAEHAVDQPAHAPGLLHDPAHHLVELVRAGHGALLVELGVGAQRGQRGAQLMAGVGEKPAHLCWLASILVSMPFRAAPSLPTSLRGLSGVTRPAAVTDANCTLSTDLGGIYFAIQTSYEHQFITQNQQVLNTAVREFKSNFAKEVNKLPALLRSTSAKLNLPGPDRNRKAAKPSSPSHPGG